MSDTPFARVGQSVVPIGHGHRAQHKPSELQSEEHDRISRAPSPPPQYPQQGASSSPPGPCLRSSPPPFSQLDDYPYACSSHQPGAASDEVEFAVTDSASASVPAYAPLATPEFDSHTRADDAVAETKAALPRDNKGESSCKKDDEEPPPAYTEGSSPLLSFSYLMAAAGGVASILTQVQQGGPPPINTLGGECHPDKDTKGNWT